MALVAALLSSRAALEEMDQHGNSLIQRHDNGK
jgi:hypothetical protein